MKDEIYKNFDATTLTETDNDITTVTSSSKQLHSNKLVLIAVVECQQYNTTTTTSSKTNDDSSNLHTQNRHHKNETNSNKLHRVRIYQHDLASSSTCTGQDLYQAIMKQCYNDDHTMDDDKCNSSPSFTASVPSCHIEIYNSKTSQFESIFHSDNNKYENNDESYKSDVVKHYGNRIRCILHYDDNDEKGTSSACNNINNNHDSNLHQNMNTRQTSTLLQIMGRYFPYDSNGISFAGKKLIVKEIINNKIDGTGLNVWDGAMLLALYLERIPEKVKSKSVLELGAGTGFVGIAASFLGPNRIILTDLLYTMELMNENILLNQEQSTFTTSDFTSILPDNSESSHDYINEKVLKCQVCDWFHPPPVSVFEFSTVYPEIILIADCVWVAELVDPLMNTLDKYCNLSSTVIITYQRRGKDAHEKFWSRLRQMFDSIVIVDTEVVCRLKKPDALFLLECTRYKHKAID